MKDTRPWIEESRRIMAEQAAADAEKSDDTVIAQPWIALPGPILEEQYPHYVETSARPPLSSNLTTGEDLPVID